MRWYDTELYDNWNNLYNVGSENLVKTCQMSDVKIFGNSSKWVETNLQLLFCEKSQTYINLTTKKAREKIRLD